MIDSSLDPRPPAWPRRQKRGSEETSSPARDLAGARCMGRPRGGLTTKIHALVDANGLPSLLKLTAGQAHDGRSAADMLAGLGEGQILLADRGYDSDALRARLARQGAWGNIKPMPHRVNVPSFSRYLYRFRNLVECSSTNSNIPSRRDTLRKTRRQLPRPRQTRRHPNMVQVYRHGGLTGVPVGPARRGGAPRGRSRAGVVAAQAIEAKPAFGQIKP